jgi:hypothetical protein
MAIRKDAFGNIIFNAAAEVPMGSHDLFSQAEAKRYGIPEFARIEMPMIGRGQLRDYAKELHTLADVLDALSRNVDEQELFIVMRAHREIRHVSNRLRAKRRVKGTRT